MKLPDSSVGISDIVQYLACPTRFEYGMRRHGGKAGQESWSPANAYGSAIHHAIHVLDQTGDIDRAIQEAFREYKQWLDPDDLQLLRDDLDLYLTREPLGYETVLSEGEIKVPLFVHPTEGQVYFRARIDRVYVRVDDDSSYMVVDYKSSKHAKSESEVMEDPQAWAYQWALREYFPEIEHLVHRYDQLRFGMIETRKNEGQLKRMHAWLVEAATAVIEDSELKPTFNDFCPWCLPSGSPVVTSTGVRPIEEIEEGDLVLTHRGRFAPVIATAQRPATEAKRLSLSAGGTAVVTGEHPLLVTPLGQLTTIDALRLSRSNRQDLPPGYVRLRGTGPGIWFDWKKALQARQWVDAELVSEGDIVWGAVPPERPCILSEDEQRILGWYIAEGCVGERSVSFTLHVKEVDYQTEIRELLEKLFDAKHFDVQVHRNTWQLYLHDRHAASWFRYFGGKLASAKRINHLAFSPAALMPLAITAWKGDGTEPNAKTTQLSYETVSRDWAYQLHSILIKNQIIAHVAERPKNDGRQTSYNIVVNGGSAVKLAGLVGGEVRVGSFSKAPPLIYQNGVTAQAVMRIEEVPVSVVHDLQVKTDESFVLPSQIAVHNCPLKMDCPEIREGLTDFALARIAVLAPREPILKKNGEPGKRLTPPQFDPDRFEEYVAELPKVDKARRTLDVFSDTLKDAMKQLSDEDLGDLGYSIRSKNIRGLTAEGKRRVFDELGDDFFHVAELSRAAAERFYGKNAEELTIIDRYLEHKTTTMELVAVRD